MRLSGASAGAAKARTGAHGWRGGRLDLIAFPGPMGPMTMADIDHGAVACWCMCCFYLIPPPRKGTCMWTRAGRRRVLMHHDAHAHRSQVIVQRVDIYQAWCAGSKSQEETRLSCGNAWCRARRGSPVCGHAHKARAPHCGVGSCCSILMLLCGPIVDIYVIRMIHVYTCSLLACGEWWEPAARTVRHARAWG